MEISDFLPRQDFGKNMNSVIMNLRKNSGMLSRPFNQNSDRNDNFLKTVFTDILKTVFLVLIGLQSFFVNNS